MPPYDVRPRPRNAEAQAKASIDQAEDLGLVPPASTLDSDAIDALNTSARERDYRARPPAPKDGALPFRVK